MTQPMTPEREKEIRELNAASLRFERISGHESCQEVLDVKDLLAELDRSRADNLLLKRDVACLMADKLRKTPIEAVEFTNAFSATIEERDRLREKLSLAVETLDRIIPVFLTDHQLVEEALSKIRGENV